MTEMGSPDPVGCLVRLGAKMTEIRRLPNGAATAMIGGEFYKVVPIYFRTGP